MISSHKDVTYIENEKIKNMNKEDHVVKERENLWINSLRRKEELRTMEESDYELMSETLYEDDRYEFYKECGNTYTFYDKVTNDGMSSGLDYFLEASMSEILEKSNVFGNMTFMDFMRSKNFPMDFKIWED